MSIRFTTVLGKGVRKIAQLRGGGSALPGLFVEKIDPKFITRTLSQLPLGVVLISGTNGKTTTTKMVTELLENQGLRVFTNRTGSNFTRGVAAALLGDINHSGKLSADIAVLELDEAHAVHFVRAIQPKYCLLLNVMRDQLDRFGEIDSTARLLQTIAEHTTETVIINRDDPRLTSDEFVKNIKANIASYGVSPSLRSLFPSDDALRVESTNGLNDSKRYSDDTCLEKVEHQTATISYNQKEHQVTLKLKGIYNILNSVGAVSLTRQVMANDLDENKMLASLENVTPAFGRGETVMINDTECEIVLVKNPGGFRLSLSSFDPDKHATMIAINDNYADGRDMSWLWDVNFDSLSKNGVSMVSGIRTYDMALRLQYDEVPCDSTEIDLKKALKRFLSTNTDQPKRIYCTYTAMLVLRRELAKQTIVEVIR